MGYTDYQAPGVNVIIERQAATDQARLTEFYPVFIGNGMTSKNRTVAQNDISADTSAFPVVTLEYLISGSFNTQMFDETTFTVTKVQLHKEIVAGTPLTNLVEGTDYNVVKAAELTSNDGYARTVIEILDTTDITATDLIYNLELRLENTDSDFDLRLVIAEDRYYAKDIFGPYKLVENGKEFFNDIAIAAEIAFRMNVPRFYYMEVPREYGNQASSDAIIAAMDKVYFKNNAYRVIPLSIDSAVSEAASNFVTSLSNPVDRRETVSMGHYDMSAITDMHDLNELIEKVGGFSESINNNRFSNIFGGESVELIIKNEKFILPMHFMAVAIACLDSTVGMALPLSTRTISVFSKLNGPRFRPRDWDKLAKKGVFIVYQNDKDEPITIRHQLTTSQAGTAEDQEYSIVKNWDAVTKRIRDRLTPYAGQNNITDGYLEKLDGTLTSAIEEVKELGLARELAVVSPWATRTIGTSTGSTEEKRNLVTKLQMTPVYPANNLDVILLV